MVLWTKGIRVRRLEGENLEKIYRFRKKIYLEKKYIEEGAVPDIWNDDYDKNAINLAAISKNEVVGAVRLVDMNKERFLPTQKVFKLKGSLPKNCMEISKLIVASNFRGGKRIILIGLMRKALGLSLKNKTENWVIFTPVELCNSFKKLGAYFKEIETFPLTEAEWRARGVMKNYFEKQDVRPYILPLKNL